MQLMQQLMNNNNSKYVKYATAITKNKMQERAR